MEVLLELYTNTLTAARSWNFSVEKTSPFFSIIKRNHEEMAEAFLPAEKSWEYLKSLLLMHAVQRPPHSVGIFTLAELHRITDFALTHYYDHFKLYRYTFTLKHVKQVDVRSSWTELPPASFPSLSEGVPVEKTTEPEVPEQPPSRLLLVPSLIAGFGLLGWYVLSAKSHVNGSCPVRYRTYCG